MMTHIGPPLAICDYFDISHSVHVHCPFRQGLCHFVRLVLVTKPCSKSCTILLNLTFLSFSSLSATYLVCRKNNFSLSLAILFCCIDRRSCQQGRLLRVYNVHKLSVECLPFFGCCCIIVSSLDYSWYRW